MFYEPIPYPSEQAIFAALQGIKSDDQGNFRPDQGKRAFGSLIAGNQARRTAAVIADLEPYPSAPLAETPRPFRRC